MKNKGQGRKESKKKKRKHKERQDEEKGRVIRKEKNRQKRSIKKEKRKNQNFGHRTILERREMLPKSGKEKIQSLCMGKPKVSKRKKEKGIAGSLKFWQTFCVGEKFFPIKFVIFFWGNPPVLHISVLTYTIIYYIINTVKEIQTPKDDTKKGGYTDVSDYDTERQHQFYF